LTADVKFCPACGSGTKPSSTANRLKTWGIVMMVIGGLYLLLAITRYNSATHQFLGAFGGTDVTLVEQTIYGLAVGIVGIVLFTSEPHAFLQLNRKGLIAFVIIMALLPILFWIPWLVEGWKEKPIK
jgi:hypothetical protein